MDLKSHLLQLESEDERVATRDDVGEANTCKVMKNLVTRIENFNLILGQWEDI